MKKVWNWIKLRQKTFWWKFPLTATFLGTAALTATWVTNSKGESEKLALASEAKAEGNFLDPVTRVSLKQIEKRLIESHQQTQFWIWHEDFSSPWVFAKTS
ncbi:hypothetical protein, partial [Mycoplasma sp. ATU-Cv-703]|uniref:hypothetical protein n=1 Tax=Mycoplasma sp. ATU-Cv-703 TaxID=2498595 RepID=UPI00137511C9